MRFPHASALTREADAKLSLGNAHSSVLGNGDAFALVSSGDRDYVNQFHIRVFILVEDEFT